MQTTWLLEQDLVMRLVIGRSGLAMLFEFPL